MTDTSGGGRLLLPAELALATLTVATVAGFVRVFDTTSFFAPVAAAAIAAHLLAALTRRRGWGIGSSAAASAVGLLAAVTWLLYLDTTFYGFPARRTLDALRADGSESWDLFQSIVAPAPVETGFVAALLVGVWAAAFLADWAAFRLWSPVEAIIPASALFVFAALLGADRHRVASTAVFLIAVLAFELLHRVAKQSATRSWVNTDADRGSRSIITAGALLGVTAVALALVLGPALPGADDEAVIGWRELDDGSGSRVTLSPMVDIRSRLVDQSDVEVFSVRATERAYWRLTSLETFDGDIWKSRGDYRTVSGQLPGSGTDTAGRTRSVQTYTIAALEALWLPAAFEPTLVEADGLDVVYEADSATLIVGDEHPSSDGITYTVESAQPRFDAESLAPAEAPIAPEVAERYLELPDDFSPTAAATAAEVTAGLTSPLEQALALQNWFRKAFTYNIDVEAGHGVDSIDAFLEGRQGYCEQFAGTYAAMARSVGLPARVAVGFTPGTQDTTNPELWHVTGRQAHAWPEVYFEGTGWVLFEPTPGRGAPFAEEYTGVPEQQDGGTPAPGPSASEPTTPPIEDTVPELDQTVSPEDLSRVDTEPDARAATAGDSADWPRRLLLVVGFAFATAVVYALLVAGAKTIRARRRRDRATTVRARARLAWIETTEHLAVAGLAVRPAETHDEYVDRVLACTDLDPARLRRLATLAAAAEYAEGEPPAPDVERAEATRRRVADYVNEVTSLRARLLHRLDPRPLLPRRAASVVTSAEVRTTTA